jgi:hypothetical protein
MCPQSGDRPQLVQKNRKKRKRKRKPVRVTQTFMYLEFGPSSCAMN